MGHLFDGGNSSYKAVLLDCHLHSMNSAFKSHALGFICYFTASERKQRLIGLSHLIFCRTETKDEIKMKLYTSRRQNFSVAEFAAAFELTSGKHESADKRWTHADRRGDRQQSVRGSEVGEE